MTAGLRGCNSIYLISHALEVDIPTNTGYLAQDDVEGSGGQCSNMGLWISGYPHSRTATTKTPEQQVGRPLERVQWNTYPGYTNLTQWNSQTQVTRPQFEYPFYQLPHASSSKFSRCSRNDIREPMLQSDQAAPNVMAKKQDEKLQLCVDCRCPSSVLKVDALGGWSNWETRCHPTPHHPHKVLVIVCS